MVKVMGEVEVFTGMLARLEKMPASKFIPGDKPKTHTQHFDGKMNIKAWKRKGFEGLDLLTFFRNGSLCVLKEKV